eukprot:10379774-Ditylum_brightwellii.AAC.1
MASKPYMSKYGNDWEERLKNSSRMKKLVNIRDLVWHMYKHTKNDFKDSEYEENFYFYHDAFSLMTAVENLDWVREKDILKHWILPENGLNKGTRDLHCGVLQHVSYTAKLPLSDKRKLSVSTPKCQDASYLRLWDPRLQESHPLGWEAGIPLSKRIVEDMCRIPTFSIVNSFE